MPFARKDGSEVDVVVPDSCKAGDILHIELDGKQIQVQPAKDLNLSLDIL